MSVKIVNILDLEAQLLAVAAQVNQDTHKIQCAHGVCALESSN